MNEKLIIRPNEVKKCKKKEKGLFTCLLFRHFRTENVKELGRIDTLLIISCYFVNICNQVINQNVTVV